MDPKEAMGLVPTKKVPMFQTKKTLDPNSILVKHRRYLQQLQNKKQAEREYAVNNEYQKAEKFKQFRQQAAN